MAAFRPHYSLCPLLGPNLVGISKDKEESTILVTLGRNIIVKQKLSDQKPLKSWSTRQSNQITCCSIYDTNNEKYVCVLNKKHVCLWNEEESNLEDVKKHSFSTAIHSILSFPGKPSIVVFENGYSENLDISLDKRKEEKPSLLNFGETLSSSFLEYINHDHALLILCTSNNKVYNVCLGIDGTPEGNLNFTLEKPENIKVLGTTVVNNGDSIAILVLWSDGQLVQLSEKGEVINDLTYNLSGISLTSPVAMAKLDHTHIAIYGADVSEEGAILLLFDLKFGMNVASRKLKFFCNPPHLYCLPSENVLLLCAVGNLVVVPFILQPSLLKTLIDSKQLTDFKAQPEIVTWNKKSSITTDKQNPLKFQNQELNATATCLWESNACNSRFFDELLPVLKEENDIEGIFLLLSSINDLPEKWLADLLNFFLDQHSSSDHFKLLQILLSIPYSDVVLLKNLREKLSTKATINLLQHLSEILQSSQWMQQESDNSRQPGITQIVDWISLILDAHHHELLIAGNDEHVKQLITSLEQLVTQSYDFLDCLGQSEPLVSLLEHKKVLPENRRKDWYAIEVVRLM